MRLKVLTLRAAMGPPYSQGGTGKYGFESEKMLVDSTSLLIMYRGEHRGTGAGTRRGNSATSKTGGLNSHHRENRQFI